ncbi:MAG TPA: L-serine ammonia-lyase, iron-sulfur-dependent, subunit alpha [Tissierellaceae bacterium]|nr:L-serine ammonia-lyase, iron-sulfur-dependent, subunit alpha [Tissierellaceae bacterium]
MIEEYSLNIFDDLLEVLQNEVKPALGCTEPVALGLGVAKAYSVVGGEVKKIDVELSPNIYKNGMGVGIPGTTEKGLVFASALAITCGDPSLGLEVFSKVDDKSVAEANKLVEDDIISIKVEAEKGNFYIRAEVTTDKGKGLCIIKDKHTNIVYVQANEDVIFEKNEPKQLNAGSSYGKLGDYSLRDIRYFVENVPYSDIKFMHDGVKLNMDIAKVGLEEKSGSGLGAALQNLLKDNLLHDDEITNARILTSAACDARMSGINMPVMSSAGSGNHGITAIIPPTVVCEHMGYDEEKLARTLAFSHLTTSYIKTFTGRLSAVCGCAIAAGIGASASIAWALGGTNKQIGGAINNMVAALAGMVCDGAKGGCAFKLSTASSEAIIQAKLALADVVVSDLDGIVGKEAELTIRNLGKFCNDGMKDTDTNIIDIMVNQ